jgi:hypothetical protein
MLEIPNLNRKKRGQGARAPIRIINQKPGGAELPMILPLSVLFARKLRAVGIMVSTRGVAVLTSAKSDAQKPRHT